MREIQIHHVLNKKTVITTVDVPDEEATRIVEAFGHLRANDGAFTAPGFAIPARSIELIRVVTP